MACLSIRILRSLDEPADPGAHSFLYRTAPRIFPTEPFLPEHRTVLERLVAGHVASAADALREHLVLSLDRAVYRIEKVRGLVTPAPVDYLLPLAQSSNSFLMFAASGKETQRRGLVALSAVLLQAIKVLPASSRQDGDGSRWAIWCSRSLH